MSEPVAGTEGLIESDQRLLLLVLLERIVAFIVGLPFKGSHIFKGSPV